MSYTLYPAAISARINGPRVSGFPPYDRARDDDDDDVKTLVLPAEIRVRRPGFPARRTLLLRVPREFRAIIPVDALIARTPQTIPPGDVSIRVPPFLRTTRF